MGDYLTVIVHGVNGQLTVNIRQADASIFLILNLDFSGLYGKSATLVSQLQGNEAISVSWLRPSIKLLCGSKLLNCHSYSENFLW
jgi:hypothetical protein